MTRTPRRRIGRIPGLLAVAAVLVLPACGGGASAAGAGSPASGSAGLRGSITVLAAASLKESFTAIGNGFQAANPGTVVTFSFGASSTLAQQIMQGAPADVFASASVKNMQQVVDARSATGPTPFAKNVLEVAVPPDNPGGINALPDLAKPGVKVALCQPQVPCGDLAQQVLAAAKVTVTPATLEADVRGTLTKVELGEVDAGLVYVTDAKAAGDTVTGVRIPPDVNRATTYPIALLSGSADPELAKAFVGYVLSAPARAELTEAGFEAP